MPIFYTFLFSLLLLFFSSSSLYAQSGNLVTSGVVYNSDSSANSSRSRSTSITVPVNLINPTQGWIAGRIKMGFPSTTTLAPDPNIFDMSQSDAESHFIYYDAGSDTFHFERTHTGGTVASVKQTFAIGDLKTVIVTWNATQIKISIDGGAFVTLANSHIIQQAPFTIGSSPIQGASRQPNSDYYWVAAGTGFLTDANAQTIYSFGNTDKKRADFPGSAAFVWWANSNAYNDDGSSSTGTPNPTATFTVTPKPTNTISVTSTNTPTSSPTSTNTPIPTVPPLPGDANSDGKVDGIDFVIWLSNYNKTVTNGSSHGDFNNDGKVDGIDYAIWLSHYQ
jgi:hypothetical protein